MRPPASVLSLFVAPACPELRRAGSFSFLRFYSQAPRLLPTLPTNPACQHRPSCIDSFRTTQPRSNRPEMNQEDFPAGGDRFPATRRSVIEAVRSIDAEERE